MGTIIPGTRSSLGAPCPEGQGQPSPQWPAGYLPSGRRHQGKGRDASYTVGARNSAEFRGRSGVSRSQLCLAGSHETGSAIVVASAGSSSGRRSCERSKTVGPMRSAIG